MKMPGVQVGQKSVNGDHNSAVQTSITGSTVFSLADTSNQDMVDIVLMIMNDDGPVPMRNMRPTKKTRNAADQFYSEHQEGYEARGQSTRNQIDWVNSHNNASPKMYDELDKRRSIAQVHMNSDIHQGAMRLAELSNENPNDRFDPKCPKCVKQKKRMEEREKRKGKLSRKSKDPRNRNKEHKNKLGKVSKRKVPKPKRLQSRYSSSTKSSKPSVVFSNKCFQCYLAAETKTVSTFRSNSDLSMPRQGTPPPSPTTVVPSPSIERNDSKSKSFHSRKRVSKKPKSLKSDMDSGNPETETGPSVSSYNSYMSTEHEPMVE